MSTYQLKVVMSGLFNIPHPLEHLWLSLQFPASPQSDAEITVAGQNPHRAFLVSTRQSQPASAVRGLFPS